MNVTTSLRPVKTWTPTDNELKLIRSVICNGKVKPSTEELGWFLNVASTSGLNPIKKQIFLLISEGRNGDRKVSVYIPFAGYMMFARESGTFDGFGELEIWTADGERGLVLPKGKSLHAVSVNAYAKDQARPAPARVHWSEFGEPNIKYYQDRQTGEQKMVQNTWATMPIHMLMKVAKSHALRDLYPDRLSHLPVEDEISEDTRARYTVSIDDNVTKLAPPSPPSKPAPLSENEAPVDDTPSEERDPVQAELQKAKDDFESLALEFAGDAGDIKWGAVRRVLSEVQFPGGGEWPWKQKYPRYESWDKAAFATASAHLNFVITEDAVDPSASLEEQLVG